MARKEKFGKLILLEESEVSLLGIDYRAAKLGPAGLEKIVTLLRLRPAISSNSEAARSLMEQVKVAAQLQNPNILRIFGIGKVESTYYVTYDFVEGRSLQQVLDRCREEAYPFAVDHALLIASKVAAALEYVHARRTPDSGARMFHGLLTPSTVLVSYEGEVRLKSFGYWPSRVREYGLLLEAEQRYLAPEQTASLLGDTRSDAFGLGAILFETLTGRPPAAGGDPAALVASVRLTSPTGDDDSVPKPLADILQKALTPDPAARYGEIADMRKAIDTLLFAGDFTPTTFNLAFFMHSLFRDDMEREAKSLKEEREASYAEYLAEEAARPAPAARPAAPPDSNKTEPFDPKGPGLPAHEAPSDSRFPEPAPVTPEPAAVHEAVALQGHPPQGNSPGFSSKEATSSFTFHKEEPKPSKTPVLIGGAAALLLVAGGASYYFVSLGRTPAASGPAAPQAPATLSPDAVAAQQRVKELEEKLHALEAEKQAAEAKAADDAKSKVEAQAKAKGQEVDQAALLRAEEEARQKTRKEQERKQQEEMKALEDQKRAEEARVAEERRRAEEVAAAQRAAAEQAAQAQAAAQSPPPTTAPEPPPTTAPAAPPLRAGALVSLSDPGVIAPILEKKPLLAYPPIALRQRVEGTVSLNLLVDERGNVVEAQVQAGSGGRSGLSESAMDYAKRWKYRPATKDGMPVKVWTEVKVVFKLPPP